MIWTIIFYLSVFGLVMGILSVNGLTQKREPVFWFLGGVIASFILARNLSTHLFVHALSIGVLWGVLNGLIQSIFFERYPEKNPKYRESYQKKLPVKPRYFVLIAGPIIGLVTGAVIGGLSLLVRTLFF